MPDLDGLNRILRDIYEPALREELQRRPSPSILLDRPKSQSGARRLGVRTLLRNKGGAILRRSAFYLARAAYYFDHHYDPLSTDEWYGFEDYYFDHRYPKAD